MDPVIAIIVAVAALLLIFIVFGYTDFRKKSFDDAASSLNAFLEKGEKS
jgi:hypothetical protein